jgi:hypothetical protein
MALGAVRAGYEPRCGGRRSYAISLTLGPPAAEDSRRAFNLLRGSKGPASATRATAQRLIHTTVTRTTGHAPRRAPAGQPLGIDSAPVWGPCRAESRASIKSELATRAHQSFPGRKGAGIAGQSGGARAWNRPPSPRISTARTQRQRQRQKCRHHASQTLRKLYPLSGNPDLEGTKPWTFAA